MLKRISEQLSAVTTAAITTAAKISQLEAENKRLQEQLEQCRMSLAVWATEAEGARLDAEAWKAMAAIWKQKAIELSPAQQIASFLPWGKN